MKHFWKSTGFKVLLCILAFLVGMMIYAATTNFHSIVGTIVSPFQRISSAVSDGIHGVFGNAESKADLSEENEKLQEQLADLRKQQVELEELRRQNKLYKEFLGLKEQNPDYTFVDARVIAEDPNDAYGNFTIGRGSVDGVSVGNAVVTPAGFVGAVYDVGLNYAKVRTILDPKLPVSCYDSRTREDGITNNTLTLAKGGEFRLSQISRSATVAIGDIIVTYGGQYPSGLLVGEIKEVGTESTGISKYAVVKPYVDILAVSEVFVIVDFEGALQ